MALAGSARASLAWAYAALTDQVNNGIRLGVYARRADEQRRRSGHLPTTFDGLDRWGRPILYLRGPTHAVFVSFGRDGRPDFADYVRFLGEEASEDPRICFRPDADTIVRTDRAIRLCAK